MARFRLIEPQEKAIYVALGNDREEGLKSLRWTLQNWRFHPISIIILHIDSTKDTVNTYFGKMPVSSVNEEMLEILRKNEQEKIDNLLSYYKALCGKVKAEIFKVDKYDKPTKEQIIDLISGLHITNLVMGLTFMKSSSWRSKSTAIGGCFYIHQHKPEFCEFFIVSGGKQILVSEGRFIEPDHRSPSPSTSNPNSPRFKNQWESYAEEIERYLQHLLSLNLDEEDCEKENRNDIVCENSPMEAEMKELKNSNMSIVEKSEYLRTKIKELNEKVRSKINEVKSNRDRSTKAEFTIALCSGRAKEIETLTAKEVANRSELKNELDVTREFLHETLNDIKEKKEELTSQADLCSQLSETLQRSKEARSQAEEEVERAKLEQSKLVVEIEEIKQQRDVFRRRIEHSKRVEQAVDDWRADGSMIGCELREFSGDELRSATEDFSERLRLKSGGDWSSIYRGRLSFQTVAIKVIDNAMSEEDFHLKVKFLSKIRHPHLLAMIGFCSEPKCIVFEYMHNGSLRDILCSSRNSKANPALPWPARVQIMAQVCSGLCYLHRAPAQPKPIVLGRLTAANVLLDRNLVPKIGGFGLDCGLEDPLIGSNLKAFGLLIMHLLTKSCWAGLVDVGGVMDRTGLARVLDETAGEWPLDLAEGLALLAVKCLTTATVGPNENLRVEGLMEELEEWRKKADGLVDRRGCEVIGDGSDEQRHDSIEVPSVFLCPIFQEVMENPHIAADGFSYEREAIEEWLKMGKDTSPMTNLKLNHKFLTRNHTLHSLIQDWLGKRSIGPP